MEILTLSVHPDEPCHGYFTGPKQMPGYSDDENPRMVEQVFVIRGDAIAKYERDFGCADDFMYVPPLIMPSFGENRVAEMQWHGERHRNDPKWARRMREYKEGSTLIQDVIRQEEQKRLAARNQSVFGPAVSVQRNGHAHEKVMRDWMDERARRTGKRQFPT